MSMSGAQCEVSNGSVTLENRWLRRTFSLNEGCVTSRFDIRPWGTGAWLPLFFFGGSAPFDAGVNIDGQLLRVGPWHHDHYGHDCTGECVGRQITRTDVGIRLDVRLRSRTGSPAVEMIMHQEVADDAPYLKRWITVVNTGVHPVTIARAVIDVLPQLRVNRQITVIDAYIAPLVESNRDFMKWQCHTFRHGPDVTLNPGESFESHGVYTLAHPDGDTDRLAAINALLRAAAPWTTRPLVRQEVGRKRPWQEWLELGRTASSQGIEAIASFVNVHFTNTGDFELSPEVFPNGTDDLRRMVDGLHNIGLKYLMYVGFCIANHGSAVRESHREWEFLGPEGRPYDPGSVGNMCPSSGWGDYLLEKCRRLVDDVGADGLQTDGCYMGQPCHASGHRHSTPGEAQYRNWRFEMDFYDEMRKKGKLIETPTHLHALLHGAVSIPQGYHEEDMAALGLFDLTTAFRGRLYTGQMLGRPGWASWGFALIEEFHGHGLWPPEEHLHEFEHMIAGHVGYGLSGFFHGWDLTNGPRSDSVLRKWLTFYRRYRETLCGDAVFVEQPSGLRPDAMLHVRPGADVPALLVAFNPLGEAVRTNWTLPLWRAGIRKRVYVVPEGDRRRAKWGVPDDVANLTLSARLEPYQVCWWEFRSA